MQFQEEIEKDYQNGTRGAIKKNKGRLGDGPDSVV
jgi:hypothetical protein